MPNLRFAVLLFAGLVCCLAGGYGMSHCQPPQGEKYALLVGVRKYRTNSGLRDLKYPEKDVTALADVLRAGGYKTVRLLTQADASDDRTLPRADNIRRELDLMLDRKEAGDTVLLAFTGHGVQFKNESDEAWFCPMDADLADRKTLISLKDVYERLRRSHAGSKLLLSDACRNDPVKKDAKSADDVQSVTKPQRIAPPGGVAALFSCSAGQESLERDELGHGMFTYFVLDGLKKGKIDLFDLARHVGKEVYDYSTDKIGQKQTPELVTEVRQGLAVLGKKLPDSKADLPMGAGNAVVGAAKGNAITNSVGMELVLIPAGEFEMGSAANDQDAPDHEKPRHVVKITKPFRMGAHEVTQAQYEAVMGTNPSWFSRNGRGADDVKEVDTAKLPVESVSWTDAQEFLLQLGKKENRTYRLPTEAEWEYACRAGTKTATHFGNVMSSTQANFDGAAPVGNGVRGPNLPRTVEVGSYPANAFGLYDMHGNVEEWCHDWYGAGFYKLSPKNDPRGPLTEAPRVLRGGHFRKFGTDCRSASRNRADASIRSHDYGFRVVTTAP